MADSTSLGSLAAIYARVSTEEQREGQTIDSQIAELERYARERNWHVVEVYKDEGWSGSLLARPELDRLRDDASAAKFNLVLLNDVDRLARDVSHLGIVKRSLECSGVEIVFRKLPSGHSPTHNLMVNILGSFAEFEREMIADRTRRGRRHKVEARQQFLGAIPSYGYRYTRKDKVSGNEGVLEVVREEAAVVRQIYTWVDQEALSAARVVGRLNKNAIRPRSGKMWAKSSVLRILRSEIYAGVWHYNKHYSCEPLNPSSTKRYKRIPKSSSRLRARADWLAVGLPSHLRIIERDIWERVQAQLTRNISFSPRSSKHFYLLKGLVRCGGCHATYVGDPNHGRFYYRCHRRCKRMPTLREEHLNDVVWTAIEEAILNPSFIIDQISQLRRYRAAEAESSLLESNAIKQDLRQILKEESRIIDAYRLGTLSPAQLGRELESLGVRKNSLEFRSQDISETQNLSFSDMARSVTDYCAGLSQRLKSFTGEERQQFLRLLVNTIVIEGKQVRIKGVIPMGERNSDDRTATTEVAQSGRNSVPRQAKKKPESLSFELRPSLPAKPFSIRSGEGLALVSSLAESQKGATLQQWQDKVLKEHGIRICLSSIHRALLKLGLTASRKNQRQGLSNRNTELLKRAA